MSSNLLAMRSRVLMAVALAAVVSADLRASAGDQDAAHSPDLFVAQMERKIELGLFADAKRLLDEALASAPRSGQSMATRQVLQTILAEIYCRSGQYDDAIRVALDGRGSLAAVATAGAHDASRRLRLRLTTVLARAYDARDRKDEGHWEQADSRQAAKLVDEALADARQLNEPLLLLEVMALHAEVAERSERLAGDTDRALEPWRQLSRQIRSIAADWEDRAMPVRLLAPLAVLHARCCTALGEYDEAVRLLEAVERRCDPSDPEKRRLITQIADVYRRAGLYDEEASAWDRVLEWHDRSASNATLSDALQQAHCLEEIAECRLRRLDARRDGMRGKGEFDAVADLAACKGLFLESLEKLATAETIVKDQDAFWSQRRRNLRGLLDVFDRGVQWKLLPALGTTAERLRYTLELHGMLNAALLEGDPERYALKLSLGTQYVAAGDFREADSYLRDAERFYRHHEPHDDIALARALNLLSEVERMRGRLSDAGGKLTEAAAIDERRPLGDAQLSLAIAINRGRLAASLGQYHDARAIFVAVIRRARALGTDANHSQSLALLNLGLMYKSLARMEQAETACRQALELRRASAAAGESDVELLPYYVALGGLAIVRRDPIALEVAVREARRISAASDQGETYLGIQVRHLEAVLHYLKYDRDSHPEDADAARRTWEELQPLCEQKGWSIDEALALYYLSRLRFLEWQKRHQKQREALEQVAGHYASYAELRKKYEEEKEAFELVLNRSQEAAEQFNRDVESYEEYRKRLGSSREELDEWRKRLADRHGTLKETKESLTRWRENLGDKLSALEGAYERFARKRAAYRVEPALPTKEHSLRQSTRGSGLLPTGEPLDEAEQLASLAVAMLERVQLYPSLRYLVLCHHAEVLRAQARMAEIAIGMSGKPGGNEAAVIRRLAIERLREAVSLAEMPRLSTVGGDIARAEFFARYATAFDLMVSLLYELDPRHHAKEALLVAERRRNRTFLDRIRADGGDIVRDLTGEDRALAKREQELLASWAVAAEELRHLDGSELTPEDQARAHVLQTELRRINEAYAVVHQELLAKSRMCRHVFGTSLAEDAIAKAVDRWIDSKEPALYYYLGENDSYLFLVGIPPGSVEFRRLQVRDGSGRESAVSANMVAQWVRDYVGVIKGEIESPESTFSTRAQLRLPQWLAVTEALVPEEVRDRILLLPHETSFHLNIFPDGKLYYLPFEALLVEVQGQLRFFADAVSPAAMCYAPSLMILERLTASRGRLPSRSVRVVSVADPAVGEISHLTNPVARRYLDLLSRPQLPQLGGSARELENAAQLWGENRVVAILGPSATEKALRDALNDGKVTHLHLATHGISAEPGSQPNASEDGDAPDTPLSFAGALVLAPPKTPGADRRNDAFLELDEVYELPLDRCEVAVLSACNTNVGPPTPLEMGTAMSRAFLSAGALRVVASQWSVADESTARLMQHFFGIVAQAVQRGDPPDYAVALQNSRRMLREDATLRDDPFYWAPFVLIGPAD